MRRSVAGARPCVLAIYSDDAPGGELGSSETTFQGRSAEAAPNTAAPPAGCGLKSPSARFAQTRQVPKPPRALGRPFRAVLRGGIEPLLGT